MKIVVFGPEQRVGAWEGDRIVDLNHAAARYLREKRGSSRPAEEAATQAPARLLPFIEAGPAALTLARQALEHVAAEGPGAAPGGETIVHAQGAVKLHAPWPYRARICCGGGNFADHLAGARSAHGGGDVTVEQAYKDARAQEPWGFWKVPDRVSGPDDDLIYPARTQRLDYEGEVAIVFNQRAKDVPESRLRELVWGVTLLNDWSIRDGGGLPRTMSFNAAKNFDGSTSLGPCILVEDGLDPQNVDVETKINGQVRQHFNTKDMVYSFAEFVAYVSRDFVFVPGDLFSSGTAEGTAMDKSRRDAEGKTPPDLFLKPGDVVEVSSPRIGLLRNRIVAK